MRVIDPASFVHRLNRTCRAALEETVSVITSSRYYEVVPEHLLEALVASEGGDVQAILRACGHDPGRLRRSLRRTLEAMHTGNPGRPVFAESVFQWLEDAWVLASLRFHAREIRSGHLLLSFADRGHRYSATTYPELQALGGDVERLRRDFDQLVATSQETARPLDPGDADLESGSPGDPDASSNQGPHQNPNQNTPGGEAVARFTTSYTERAAAGKIDPIFGRHAEIRQLVEILARRRKNNPILVGEPGVGKTALVEGLALAIAAGDVPTPLREVDLRELDMGLLQAGAGVRGELERRLKAVIAGVQGSPRPIVLFIDEAHTIVGREGEAANLLKPALARGELRTIAATTWSEYKKYFEKDAAFARRFQPVKVEEPGEALALRMLRGLRETYEAAHGVTIRDGALEAAVALSHRYIAARQLPDKAVDLLDTAATRVRIAQEARPEALVEADENLAALGREEALLRRECERGDPEGEVRLAAVVAEREAAGELREALHRRWEAEQAALREVEAARRGLAEASEVGRPAALAAKQAAEARFAALAPAGDERLIHPEVDAEAIAGVVATWTGIPAGKIRGDAVKALLNLEEHLARRVRGQERAVQTVAETLKIAAAELREPSAPLGVLLFVGPSGVGKTETAAALADLLYGGERFMTVVNMSEFQEKHAVSRLIGSPPGYVGYGEGGVLTEAVRQRPYSVVLLDECEKADLEVMNLFYQVFDKGTLADGEGRVIDFKNTIIILTSNLAADQVASLAEEGADVQAIAAAIRPTLSRHFKAALLGRMTIVPFMPLPPPILGEIARLKLDALGRRITEHHGISWAWGDGLLSGLVARCERSEAGAREVDQLLRASLMPALSQRLLEAFAAGETPTHLTVDLDAGEWAITLEGGDA